jgi:hypothetical protein
VAKWKVRPGGRRWPNGRLGHAEGDEQMEGTATLKLMDKWNAIAKGVVVGNEGGRRPICYVVVKKGFL